jgi:hypothetical protein
MVKLQIWGRILTFFTASLFYHVTLFSSICDINEMLHDLCRIGLKLSVLRSGVDKTKNNSGFSPLFSGVSFFFVANMG